MARHAFIIGAQRSGTSYLGYALSSNPLLCFAQPLFPEPKFFLNPDDFGKGKKYYYEKYFQRASANSVCIEKSTSYFETPEAARRIANWFPDAAIIAVLRNPIHRAISNYYFSKANGLEKLDIIEAFNSENERTQNNQHTTSVSPFAYTQRGYYAKWLAIWRDLFPKTQIKLILFENMINSTESILHVAKSLLNEKGKITFTDAPINKGKCYKHNTVPSELLKKLRKGFKDSVFELDRQWGIGAANRWGF
jgi:hypothetical protein